jgi:hypothetical protein
VRLRVHTILHGQFIETGTPIEDDEVPGWLLKYREPAQAREPPRATMKLVKAPQGRPAITSSFDFAETHEHSGQIAVPMRRSPRGGEGNPRDQARAEKPSFGLLGARRNSGKVTAVEKPKIAAQNSELPAKALPPVWRPGLSRGKSGRLNCWANYRL